MQAEEIIQRLKGQGYKLTPQRRKLVEILAQSETDLTAEEIYSQMKEVYPDVGLDTVYRNLHLLTKLGAVTALKLAGRNTVFALNRNAHHHALICLECGREAELTFCPIKEMEAAARAEHGYIIESHRIEIFGVCPFCQPVDAVSAQPK